MSEFIRRFLDDHALRWPLLYPLFMVGGIATYLSFSIEPALHFLLVSLSMSCLFWLVFKRKRVQFAVSLCLAMICFSLGMAIVKARTILVKAPIIQYNIGPVTIEGRLVQVENGAKGNRLRIEVGAISNLSKADTPEYVRITQRKNTELWPGRLVRCLAFLSPPPTPLIAGDFNFARQAYYERLGGVGFALGSCSPVSVTNNHKESLRSELKSKVNGIRRALAIYIFDLLGEKSGGMAAAMITGERSFLSVDDQETLRNVGLAHLLAISGLHMGLAAGVFFYLVRVTIPIFEFIALRLPVQKLAATGAIFGSTAYLFLSGATVATQRAYIMALVALLAILIDRPALSLRSVAVAMMVIILLQPETVVSPGFQMSFAATAALIALYENWPRRTIFGFFQKLKAWSYSLLATSIVASLATAPFAAFHFNRIAPLSIIAYVVVMPVVTLWAAPSAVISLLMWPLNLHELLLISFGQALEIILDLSSFISMHSPQGGLSHMSLSVFASSSVALLVSVLFVRWFKAAALLLLILAGYMALTSDEAIVHIDKNGVL